MDIPNPGRTLALSALTVACVVLGPNPQLAAAFERIYAVAVVGDEQARDRAHRAPRGLDRRRVGPPVRHPRSRA